jgi:hypothetical protein
MSTEGERAAPPILIVSGGIGTSGEQVVNSVLSAFLAPERARSDDTASAP